MDKIVTSPTEILRSLEGQLLKQHIVFDSQGRDKYVFEAPVDAKEGTPCLVTEYTYLATSNSTRIINHQERTYRWKAIWDAQFEFDPTVDYDIDGDGQL